jgi:hypothetical protein
MFEALNLDPPFVGEVGAVGSLTGAGVGWGGVEPAG